MDAASPSGKTWVPGKVIGQHTLLREIARGGMAEIWLAFHKGKAGFERLVVIKRILADAQEDPEFVTLFLDEARIAAQLHHPNIVQVYDLGELEGSYFMVMEFLPGQSLGRVVRRFLQLDGRVPSALAVRIISDAARGLGHAHRKRRLDGQPLHVVHRDVSPQNLMVTYDGQVKVLDFGIARAAGRLTRTQTGVVRGKLAYMSPEQALNEPLDATADVFGLGIILFELLTGTRMYEGADDLAVLQRLASGEPLARVREIRTHIDARLEAIVARAVAMRRQERYPDGQALHEALEGWLAAHPRPAEPLDAAMRRCFSSEVEQLPQLYKSAQEAAVTPASQPSLPNFPRQPAAPRRTWPLVAGALGLVVVTSGVTYFAATRANATSAPVAVAATPTSVGQAPSPEPGPPSSEPVAASPPDEPLAGAAPGAHEPSTIPTEPFAENTTAERTTPGMGEDADTDAGAGASIPVGPATGGATDTPLAKRPHARAKAPRGLLTLDTEPWTRVFLGKTALGETPLVDVKIPAGRHRLRLVNPVENIDTVIEVQVGPGERVRKKLALY